MRQEEAGKVGFCINQLTPKIIQKAQWSGVDDFLLQYLPFLISCFSHIAIKIQEHDFFHKRIMDLERIPVEYIIINTGRSIELPADERRHPSERMDKFFDDTVSYHSRAGVSFPGMCVILRLARRLNAPALLPVINAGL